MYIKNGASWEFNKLGNNLQNHLIVVNFTAPLFPGASQSKNTILIKQLINYNEWNILKNPETLECWIRENGIHNQNPEISQLALIGMSAGLRPYKLSGNIHVTAWAIKH